MSATRDKFEAVFLDGRTRENPLVSSQLQLGADGEYFNSNTRALYRFYLAGWEDGCANAAEDVEASALCVEVLPEDPPEQEACPKCKSAKYDGLECSDCGFWDIPF